MFTHIQSTPAQTWTITHNLGGTPVVDVLSHNGGTLFKILPLNIRVITDMSIVVEFSSPRTGVVNLIV